MKEKLIPFAWAKNIYDIYVDFYRSMNIKTLIIDLDNTLDSYKTKMPSNRAIQLIGEMKNSGLRPVIVSNNRGKRVKEYAEALGVECIHSAMKPFPYKINRFIVDNQLNKEEIILIGDQLLTDVKAAKNVGIKSILLEKLVKEDQFTTHFNRIFDRMIRKRLKNKNLLKEWRELYGQGKKSS